MDPQFKALIPLLLVLGVPSLSGNLCTKIILKKFLKCYAPQEWPLFFFSSTCIEINVKYGLFNTYKIKKKYYIQKYLVSFLFFKMSYFKCLWKNCMRVTWFIIAFRMSRNCVRITRFLYSAQIMGHSHDI